MRSFRRSLLAGATLPLIAGLVIAQPVPSAAETQLAPASRASAANPTAVPRPGGAREYYMISLASAARPRDKVTCSMLSS